MCCFEITRHALKLKAPRRMNRRGVLCCIGRNAAEKQLGRWSCRSERGGKLVAKLRHLRLQRSDFVGIGGGG